jgi:hypothetical protein
LKVADPRALIDSRILGHRNISPSAVRAIPESGQELSLQAIWRKSGCPQLADMRYGGAPPNEFG